MIAIRLTLLVGLALFLLQAERPTLMKAETKEKAMKRFHFLNSILSMLSLWMYKQGAQCQYFISLPTQIRIENLKFGLEGHLIIGLMVMALCHHRKCCQQRMSFMSKPLVSLSSQLYLKEVLNQVI